MTAGPPVQEFLPAGTNDASAAPAPWRRWVPAVSLVVGVLLLPASVLVYRGGITTHEFHWPEATSPVATVQRYNGAWICGAFGLAILGAILIVVAVGRLRDTRSGSQRPGITADPAEVGGLRPVHGSGPLT